MSFFIIISVYCILHYKFRKGRRKPKKIGKIENIEISSLGSIYKYN
jgi:hypothetical protein